MSIDPLREDVYPLSGVPKRLRRQGRCGRPTHVSTIYRWAMHGVNGARLETIKIGGTMYTSDAALRRFFNTLTNPEAPSEPADDDRRQDRVESELAAEGI